MSWAQAIPKFLPPARALRPLSCVRASILVPSPRCSSYTARRTRSPGLPVCSHARIFAVCLPGRGFGWEDDLVGRFSVLEHTALSEGLQEMTYKGLLTHTFGGFFTYARQVKSICLFSLSPAHWPRRLGQSRCVSNPKQSLSPLSQSGFDGTTEINDAH